MFRKVRLRVSKRCPHAGISIATSARTRRFTGTLSKVALNGRCTILIEIVFHAPASGACKRSLRNKCRRTLDNLEPAKQLGSEGRRLAVSDPNSSVSDDGYWLANCAGGAWKTPAPDT